MCLLLSLFACVRLLAAFNIEMVELAVEPGSSHSDTVLITDEQTHIPIFIAGLPLSTVTLHADVDIPGSEGLLALVPLNVTEDMAMAGGCGAFVEQDTGCALAGEDLGTISGNTASWPLLASSSYLKPIRESGVCRSIPSQTHRRRSALKVGGRFRLCFTDSDTWADPATLVPSRFSSIIVYGALPYPGHTRMTEKKHYCFSGGFPGTNCKVKIQGAVGNTSASSAWSQVHRLTWAEVWGWEDTCGVRDGLPTLIGAPSSPFILGGRGGVVFDLGYSYDTEPRNFWLCYCPGFTANANGLNQPCSNKEDFQQVVGYLYIFAVEQLVATIVPLTNFSLRVRCGNVAGCQGNFDNRIKVLEPFHWIPNRNVNNKAIWDEKSGCRQFVQSSEYASPPNCVSVTDCSSLVNGGDHQDDKYFHGLKMNNRIVAGLSKNRVFDLCYCDSACHSNENWFKVGVFNVSRAWVVPKTPQSLDSKHGNLEVVSTPGIIRVGTKPIVYEGRDGNTNSLQGTPSFKLLLDNGQEVTDSLCAKGIPDPLWTNHGCLEPGTCYPYGWLNATSHTIAFNSRYYYGGLKAKMFPDDPLYEDTDLTMSIAVAGIYAVCYCESDCQTESNWAKFSRTVIRGPSGDQYWQYQTRIPFKLVMRGWGLRGSNRIRITTSASSCNSPDTVMWERFFIRAVHYPYFNATVLAHDSVHWQFEGYAEANTIVNIQDYHGQGSVLVFRYDAVGFSIDPIVKAGDVIAIGQTEADPTDKHPATEEHFEMLTVPWGHTLMYKSPEDTSGREFVFPARMVHDDGNPPTWSKSMRADWRRTSQADFERITSIEARRGLRVCWSDAGSSDTDFVTQAGVLDIEDPPSMVYSNANLAGTAIGGISPLVFAFKTSTMSAFRYRKVENSMVLTIMFEDPHFEIRKADLSFSAIVDESRYNGINREDQVVCGWFFTELWSSGPDGFPVPKGCFFAQEDRMYSIVFDPKNGLTDNTEYQVAINARVLSPANPAAWKWDEKPVARLFSMDDIILRSEYAVEAGACYLRPDRMPRASAGSRKMESGGFKIVDDAASNGLKSAGVYVNLPLDGDESGRVSFELRAAPGGMIKSRYHIRIFLFPLTGWRLDPECGAVCRRLGSGRVCSVLHETHIISPSCAGKGLCAHDNANRNVVHLVLPAPMDPVIASDPVNITLIGLRLPLGGTFPIRIALELTDRDDDAPEFVWSSGRLIFVAPSMAFAGVVNTLAGDGNDRPFRGDLFNSLYVRLGFGATLRSHETNVSFSILLPDQYTCAEVGVTPSTLKVFGSDSPQGRGRLPASTENQLLGGWKLEANECRFNLGVDGCLYAGQSIFLQVVVNNPRFALPMADTRNVWHVVLRSRGDLVGDMPLVTPALKFASASGQFSNNVAVQGKLTTSLSPLVYSPNVASNELYVFVLTEQTAGPRSQIRLFGPYQNPFDFGKRCEPRFLPERYYVSVLPLAVTYPLPGMKHQIDCSGVQSTLRPSRYSGASIQLSGRLRGNRQYGFAMKIGNPSSFDPSHFQDWHVITYTSKRGEIDGSPTSIPENPRQVGGSEKSFGLFAYQPLQLDVLQSFQLSLASSLPSIVMGGTTWIAIGGIRFPSDTSCTFRVTAPALYQWSYLQREFIYRPAEVRPLLPSEGRLPDGSYLVTDELPTGFIPSPLVEPLNEFASTGLFNFKTGRRYGVATKAIVPNRPNTASINTFIVQCGWSGGSLAERPLSAVLDASNVAALVDANVDHTTNIVNRSNRLRLSIRTTTPLRSTGALIIRGPPGFSGTPKCTLFSTSPSLDAYLNLVRAKFLEYEDLLVKQAVTEIAVGKAAEEFLSNQDEVKTKFEVLLDEVRTMWLRRRERNALPIDVGCFFQKEAAMQPFTVVTLQVGLPNSLHDARLGTFARRYASDLFSFEQRYEAWLPIGLYELEIDVVNPGAVVVNREQIKQETGTSDGVFFGARSEVPSGCGYTICWEFSTFLAPFSDRKTADMSAVANGFSVLSEMLEARLVNLSEAQRRAVGKDDRPDRRNEIVFVFAVNRTVDDDVHQNAIVPWLVAQTLIIKAPHGYEFPDDCVAVINISHVFGGIELVPLEMGLAEWKENNGRVTSCDGQGKTVTLAIEGTTGLLPRERYAIRLQIRANPSVTPFRNQWSLEFVGQQRFDQQGNKVGRRHAEASAPFDGFELWTFTDVRILPRTTERNSLDSAGFIVNPTKVLFNITNALPNETGVLRLKAPRQFSWKREVVLNSTGGQTGKITSWRCAARVLTRPSVLPPEAGVVEATGSLATFFWQSVANNCTVDPVFENVILLKLIDGSVLSAGGRFAIIADLINPYMELTAGTFELSSFRLGSHTDKVASEAGLDGYQLVDIAEVIGFPVTKGLHFLEVRPETGEQGTAVAVGGEISTIRVTAAFVEPIFPGDVLRLKVPPFYVLNGAGRKKCIATLNRAKPGTLPGQKLRCYVGINCVLHVVGNQLRDDSFVQLHSTARECGDLPGLTVDTRRTQATHSWSSVSKKYDLGPGFSVGIFKVCYCHGDGGCHHHSSFCQGGGILTITDLCASANCSTVDTESCTTRCDPRTGFCVNVEHRVVPKTDGEPCEPSGSSFGTCSDGTCMNASFANFDPDVAQDTPDNEEKYLVTSPSCTFDEFECLGRTLSWSVGHEGYPRLHNVILDVAALHPVSVPVEDNYFSMEHVRDGVVRGARVVNAYGIQPQFASVVIELVGVATAAGALSDLRVSLLPIQDATSVWLRARRPIGFEFSAVFLMGNATLVSAGGDTLEFSCTLKSGSPFTVLLRDARLPLAGGTGVFDVASYQGAHLKDIKHNITIFRTPVHIAVSEIDAQNSYKRDATRKFEVEASFGNRLGDALLLRARLQFSATIPGPSTLVVSAPSWRFASHTARTEMHGALSGSRPLLFELVNIVKKDGFSDTLEMRFPGEFKGRRHHSYVIMVEVLAPNPDSCGCWRAKECHLCMSNWTIKVEDGASTPLATNDALMLGFPLVSQLDFGVFCNKAPPNSIVDLTLRFPKIGVRPATIIVVLAPLGYDFPYTCLSATSVAEIANVTPGSVTNDGGSDLQGISVVQPEFKTCIGRLNRAVLSMSSAGLFKSTTITLRVRTARTTPVDNRWYAEGRLSQGNVQVAWGVADGVDTEGLRNVAVEYGSFAMVNTFFLVRFSTQTEVQDAGSIEVFPPPGYALSCDGFHSYVMPQIPGAGANITCFGRRQGIRVAFTRGTLQVGPKYYFAVRGGTAAASAPDAAQDTFNVQILDKSGFVAESSYVVQASKLVEFGNAESPTLLWYDLPQPGGTVWATIGFFIPSTASSGLRAIRLRAPEGFQHAVKTTRPGAPDGVTFVWLPVQKRLNLPGTFSDYMRWIRLNLPGVSSVFDVPPASKTGVNLTIDVSPPVPPLLEDHRWWLDLGRTEEVGIRVRPGSDWPASEFFVQFPVVLPVLLPPVNVWRVVFDFGENSSSFVLPGFEFGESTLADLERRVQHKFQETGVEYLRFSQRNPNSAVSLRTQSLSVTVSLGGTLLLAAKSASSCAH